MRKGWIENDRIRDIAPGDPDALYHPDIAKLYDTEVPDDAANGDGWINGQLVKPEPPAPVEPPAPAPATPPQVSPVQFKLLFTPQERVAIKAARATDPVIDDFYDIVDDVRLTHVDLGLKSTQAAIGYLAQQGLIDQSRVSEIMQGQVR